MGSTNNATANSAVKNMTNRSDLPTDIEDGFVVSPLSGSVGFGGDNQPDDVFAVSEALVANDRLDEPTSIADDAFNSKIITAQQDMADGLKPDGLINPGGPTENRFTNLVQGDMMKAPAIPGPATGSRAGNAAAMADTKADVVDAVQTTVLQNTNDPDRTSFRQAQDMKRLNKAKTDATKASARAERADIKQREKAQQDQIMAAQKARQQTAQKSKQIKDTATKAAKGAVNLLGTSLIKPADRHPGLRQDDKGNGGDTLTPITDEVFSANQRSAHYLASRNDIQDFPRWEAEDINTQGEPAIAKTANLIQQTHDLAPEQAKRLYEQTVKGINPDAQDMLDRALGRPTIKPPVKEDKLSRPGDVANASPPRAEPYYPPAPSEEDPDVKMMFEAGTDNGDGSHQLGVGELKDIDVVSPENDDEGLTMLTEQDDSRAGDIDSEPFQPMAKGGADYVPPNGLKDSGFPNESIEEESQKPQTNIGNSTHNRKNLTLEDFEWNKRSAKRHINGMTELKVKGPIKIQGRGVSMGLDGVSYEVDWYPLDEKGKVLPKLTNPNSRPKRHSAPTLFTKSPPPLLHTPPYDNPNGFLVEVRTPPQQSPNGASLGVDLDIFTTKDGDVLE